SKLNADQAMRYFLLGYTAKVAGTERGVSAPQATFSSCFGSPFLPRPPKFYGKMLKERMEKHEVNVWLLNTGISGGPFGVGKRMPLLSTRALVSAAVSGLLDSGEFVKVPILDLLVPLKCPRVDSTLLQPRLSWDDTQEYDRKAQILSDLFEKEYEKYI
ncbi:MAG: phosphoenolpyruvate carboxykinase (ATP), partial [Candidatus Dadabacteria bacterium]|nr:phosphoenolpyruvate carboxykinase (ATP) [Candidatus Dadabacteria bacterium]